MKLLVVFTGGTIGCSVDQEGYFSPDQKNGYKLISLFQEAKKADSETRENEIVIDTVEPYSTLSEQLNSTFVQKLIDCVKSNAEKEYDGIIVTHGTDTLQYAACALGYALGNSSIPVLLVSSNYILDDPKMNGLENFIAAVDFIKGGYGKGVFVAYKNKQEGVTIHRGTRMDAHHTFDDCIYSVGDEYYGRFEGHKFVKNPAYAEAEDGMEVLASCWKGDASKVMWITPYPGFSWNFIPLEDQAVLIKTYHSGTMNTDNVAWKLFMDQAASARIPVFLIGSTEEMTYASNKAYEDTNVHLLPKMSPIAAYMKLAMGIASGKKPEEVMFRPLGGDMVK